MSEDDKAQRDGGCPPTTCSPLREMELRELASCRVCGELIGQKMLPVLWKVKVERHMLDMQAIQRQQGLAMMMGGNALLAHHMGPNQAMTKPISDATCMICDECMMERLPEIL